MKAQGMKIRSWLQLAKANVSVSIAAKEKSCSVGTAARRLSEANATLDLPMTARLSAGLMQVAADQLDMQVRTVTVGVSAQKNSEISIKDEDRRGLSLPILSLREMVGSPFLPRETYYGQKQPLAQGV